MQKSNKISFLVLFLSIIILLILGYVFCYKSSSLKELRSNDEKRIIFPIVKQPLQDLQPALEEPTIIEADEYEDLSINTNDNQPIIAILMDGLGTLKSIEASNFPPEISLGTTLYNESAHNDLINTNDVLLNIPLESKDNSTSNSDSQTLLISNSNEENIQKLSNILDNLKENQAVYTSSDELYTSSEKNAQLLLSQLKHRNLIYLCGKQDQNSTIYQLAEKMSFHILANDVILDEEISPEAINENLLKMEKIAKQRGYAVAIGSLYPLTLELLLKWIPSLEEKGIKIVPIHDFYNIIQQRKTLSTQEKVTE